MTLATTIMTIMAVLPTLNLLEPCSLDPAAAETLALAVAARAVVLTNEAAEDKVWSWVGVTVLRMILVVGTTVLVEVVARTAAGVVDEVVGAIELVLGVELEEMAAITEVSASRAVVAAVAVEVTMRENHVENRSVPLPQIDPDCARKLTDIISLGQCGRSLNHASRRDLLSDRSSRRRRGRHIHLAR